MRRNTILTAMLCLFMSDTSYRPNKELRSEAEVALAHNGITAEQRTAYVPLINDLLQRGISPYGYDLTNKITDFVPNLISGHNQFDTPEREDAWRLYLGLPQIHGTFGISDYTPSRGVEYCYSINNFFDSLLGADTAAERIQEIVQSSHQGARMQHADFNVMGAYTLHTSKDEKGRSFLFYHDLWDLDVFPERGDGFFGKPFVIYDRLYFDEHTYQPERPMKTVSHHTSDLM